MKPTPEAFIATRQVTKTLSMISQLWVTALMKMATNIGPSATLGVTTGEKQVFSEFAVAPTTSPLKLIAPGLPPSTPGLKVFAIRQLKPSKMTNTTIRLYTPSPNPPIHPPQVKPPTKLTISCPRPQEAAVLRKLSSLAVPRRPLPTHGTFTPKTTYLQTLTGET